MSNFILNIFHDEKGINIKALQDGGLDARYVFVAGDTMSGTLFIDTTPNDVGLVLKQGQKLVLDG